MTISYAVEDGLGAGEFIDVLSVPAWMPAAPSITRTLSGAWSKTPI